MTTRSERLLVCVRNEQLNSIAMPQRGKYGAAQMCIKHPTSEKIHRDVYTSNTPSNSWWVYNTEFGKKITMLHLFLSLREEVHKLKLEGIY